MLSSIESIKSKEFFRYLFFYISKQKNNEVFFVKKFIIKIRQ